MDTEFNEKDVKDLFSKLTDSELKIIELKEGSLENLTLSYYSWKGDYYISIGLVFEEPLEYFNEEFQKLFYEKIR